ncbi:hypothetical protein BRAS3809_4700001 [Bradyrhizobium sp. STM 3809]|nr:hypothetical protein BRAS3809_4700001 [Bradyrhizobium sp. STM 3809]
MLKIVNSSFYVESKISNLIIQFPQIAVPHPIHGCDKVGNFSCSIHSSRLRLSIGAHQ